ncbi:MAG: RNA-binding protein [Methanobacterium sp.]|nr:RNA-binding protein [Methanobacterium sp.]
MKIRKRYYLQKKKFKKVKEQLGDFSMLIKSKSKVEILEGEPYNILLIDREPLIMMIEDKPVPTLKGALELEIMTNYVVVDMGAVKFVAKGADIMSPGITEADLNIKKGDFVIIVDETHRKPLAVGKSLISGPEMVENTEGKAIETIHYIGDKIWNLTV